MNNDLAYTNSAFISDGDGYLPRWQARAAVFRAGRDWRDVPYGEGMRQGFDLFLPDQEPRGVVVFVHGGYWKAMDRKDWSHLAAGPLMQGWACAMLGYTLAPDARIAQMTAEVAGGLQVIADVVAGPIVVTGHSAGGHLAARMGCADVTVTGRVVRVVPISPVSDLAPLIDTAMNDTLWINAEEALAESPAHHALRAGVQAHVWVGGQERPAFLWQARTLSEAWGCPWTVEPGRHHFDVVDGLEDPQSALMKTLVGGIS